MTLLLDHSADILLLLTMVANVVAVGYAALRLARSWAARSALARRLREIDRVDDRTIADAVRILAQIEGRDASGALAFIHENERLNPVLKAVAGLEPRLAREVVEALGQPSDRGRARYLETAAGHG